QVDDPNPTTSINIDPWINGEPLGATKRLVTWYRAGYYHNFAGGDTDPCELVGPRLEYLQPCYGRITMGRLKYSCNDTLDLALDDSDLAGSETVDVTVDSAAERTPETVVLRASPPGSGHFTGSLPT